jgi:hypothetical protein
LLKLTVQPGSSDIKSRLGLYQGGRASQSSRRGNDNMSLPSLQIVGVGGALSFAVHLRFAQHLHRNSVMISVLDMHRLHRNGLRSK